MTRILVACLLYAVAVWHITAGVSRGHEWYDAWCCSGDDCAPIRAGNVTATPEGWRVTLSPGDHPLVTKPMVLTVPFEGRHHHGSAMTRKSQDEHFHLCIYPQNTLRCLYVPEFGF